jgi:hypothetical protein
VSEVVALQENSPDRMFGLAIKVSGSSRIGRTSVRGHAATFMADVARLDIDDTPLAEGRPRKVRPDDALVALARADSERVVSVDDLSQVLDEGRSASFPDGGVDTIADQVLQGATSPVFARIADRLHQTLVKAFTAAVREGLIDRSPLYAAGIKRPSNDRQKDIEPLTAKACASFFVENVCEWRLPS